ncbi:type IV secretion system DNA-binding domain-containing protein [Candidatus Parcubacteria bacterium]|nr:type IV secretion system DNA-binding domain-containing protein [Candidatus Parcubacteria bacterium]
MGEINFFAKTDFRNQMKKFGIKTDDRRRHVYVVGKTGMGKTAMLENMAIQDIQQGNGIGFVDPHGEAAERLLDFVPSNRINDVIYFNPADINFPIAFNIMEKVDSEYRHLVASGLMGVFKKIWPDVWSARMEYILHNSILALLEYPDATLLGVNRVLSDVDYRKKVIDKITDPIVKSFWVTEFSRYSQKYEVEATAAIQNKIGQFISTPLIRNIIGQVKSSLDMREIMDKKKILILNLSKGRIGEDASRLLGCLLITKLQLAVMSRVDIPEEERKDFFLYVDEFQNFATESFVSILSEARKYRLSLILGHQYITQMEEGVRDAVFGNVGTLISFRVGADDAEFLEKEFSPEFWARDIVNLAKYNIYLKLMINGIAGNAFSAQTLPPTVALEKSNKDKIIKVSQERYGVPLKIVEEKISRWTELAKAPPVVSSESKQLYDAKCSRCGKDIKVIFAPDGVRPVYCKPCLGEIEKEKVTKIDKKIVQNEKSLLNKVEQPKEERMSLKEALREVPVPFSARRELQTERPKRKEVNLGELKEVLKESVQKPKEEVKKGVIKPGETIKFE